MLVMTSRKAITQSFSPSFNYHKILGRHNEEAYDKSFRPGDQYALQNGSVTVAEIIEQRVGIDRCDCTTHTSFALALMETAKFDWRRTDSHEWEVGRWPGLRLTLLAQPEWGEYRPHFAICPFPRNGHDVPFILLMALGGRIESSFLHTGDASVTLFYLTIEQVRRDVTACAHRAFDLALRLQHPHLEARYVRECPKAASTLPCMKSMMEIQCRFMSPMSGFQPPIALTE